MFCVTEVNQKLYARFMFYVEIYVCNFELCKIVIYVQISKDVLNVLCQKLQFCHYLTV